MVITEKIRQEMKKALAEGTCKQFAESHWVKWDDLVKNIKLEKA